MLSELQVALRAYLVLLCVFWINPSPPPPLAPLAQLCHKGVRMRHNAHCPYVSNHFLTWPTLVWELSHFLPRKPRCHVYQVTPQDSHHGLDCRTQSAMPAAAKALSCRILTHESEDEGRQEAGRRGGGAEGRREVNLQQMRIFQWLCRSSVGKHSVEHAPSRRGGGEKRVSYSAF